MRCVIYARYSSDGQREESIEGQFRECNEYAERHNMTVIGTYLDRALSARTDGRPKAWARNDGKQALKSKA